MARCKIASASLQVNDERDKYWTRCRDLRLGADGFVQVAAVRFRLNKDVESLANAVWLQQAKDLGRGLLVRCQGSPSPAVTRRHRYRSGTPRTLGTSPRRTR